MGFSRGRVVKNLLANSGDTIDMGSTPGWKTPGVGIGNSLQNLPGKFHGQRSLVGCNPYDCKDSDMTKCAQVHPPTFIVEFLMGLYI